MARYLIIRLSAMGDVAMLIPLLYAVARANEQHEFILLTQPFFTELLLDAPDNVEGMAIDVVARSVASSDCCAMLGASGMSTSMRYWICTTYCAPRYSARSSD